MKPEVLRRDTVLRNTQGALAGEALEVIVDEAALLDVVLIVRLEKRQAPVGAR